MDKRLQELENWVRAQMFSDNVQATSVSPLAMVSGDASFRRYFRTQVEFSEANPQHLIAVDAPPEKEDNPSFVRIAEGFKAQGVNVPDIFAADFQQGFMLQSDFGDTLLLAVLTPDNVNQFYDRALSDLVILQQATFVDPLPPYDDGLLMREMQLFPDWLLGKYLNINMSEDIRTMLADAFQYLRDQALAQPQVSVHRDYHARNIMVLDGGSGNNLGYIDFQDAVRGPITYDLVSLVRDCYARWPRDQVSQWIVSFQEKLTTCGLISPVSEAQFRHWVDTMGAQRHIKAAGIFARLYLRDGKAGYLKDIPRTVNYIREEVAEIAALQGLADFIDASVVPALCEKDPRAADYFTPLVR